MWDLAACANGEQNVVPVAFKDVTDDGKLVVGDVFLETTLNNIKGNNGRIAISAYDAQNLEGYQIKGTAEYVTEGAIVDTFKAMVLLTLVLIFMFQSEVILKNPIHIILIAIPLIIQTFLIFGIAYVACYLLKLLHNIAAPAGMIGASNFFELAVAVAIAVFGTTSAAALATTVGVLTEVPVMLMLVRIANKTKGRFL